MNGHDSDDGSLGGDEATAYGGSAGELVTVRGVVQFFWDSGDERRHLLVNIEPDDHHKPDAYEVIDDLRDRIIGSIDEGVQIEIEYRVEHHEVVDPDGATTIDSHRAQIVDVRIVG